MIRYLTFSFVLMLTWILWSGHLELLPIIFGLCSCLLVLIIAVKMRILDHESWPISVFHKLLRYWFWLLWQVIKSNIDVARRIISPNIPIDPRTFTIEIQFQSDLGRVIFANSITLTPGTVTTKLDTKTIEVHALTQGAEEDIKEGTMAAYICAVEKNY